MAQQQHKCPTCHQTIKMTEKMFMLKYSLTGESRCGEFWSHGPHNLFWMRAYNQDKSLLKQMAKDFLLIPGVHDYNSSSLALAKRIVSSKS